MQYRSVNTQTLPIRAVSNLLENSQRYLQLKGCNVSPSPTEVSPTENSWMLHPLDKVSLDYFTTDRTIPSLNSDLIGVLCVGRACIRRRGANPINLVRGVGEAGQTSLWSIRCRRPTEAAIAADRASFMLYAVQGRDTSVRGTISKGCFVQGGQHPRIFGRGHIGRGHINPASLKAHCRCHWHQWQTEKNLQSWFSIFTLDTFGKQS